MVTRPLVLALVGVMAIAFVVAHAAGRAIGSSSAPAPAADGTRSIALSSPVIAAGSIDTRAELPALTARRTRKAEPRREATASAGPVSAEATGGAGPASAEPGPQPDARPSPSAPAPPSASTPVAPTPPVEPPAPPSPSPRPAEPAPSHSGDWSSGN